MVVKVELNATGEIFFQNLQRLITKRTARELNREVDLVRFTQDRSKKEGSCWVALMEAEIADNWTNAVDWFQGLNPPCQVYAFIEQDGD
jgi:hypothetical protein